jgi:hypothetical protein
MTGVALGIGTCYCCSKRFMFDPDTVPTIRVDRETGLPMDQGGDPDRSTQYAVCPDCCRAANVRRAAAGLSLINEEDTTKGLYRRQLAASRP